MFDNGNVPQLRLSFGTILTPIYTDFQTTSLGDLAILPASGVNVRRVGINTTTPTNTLEINSLLASATTNNGVPAALPFTGNATGRSGLTFSDLSSASIPQANSGPGVLSVNAAGDVIYVPGSSGAQVGNYCGTTPLNPLTSDYQIPLNNFDYHFTDNGSLSPANNVGIGTSCPLTPTPLPARLTVVNPAMNVGILATTTKAVPNNIGVRGIASNASLESTGIFGQAIVSGPTFNTGVYGYASNAIQSNYAGKFLAIGGGNSNNGIQANASGGIAENRGVVGQATGGNVAYGVYGLSSMGVTTNYGVYGSAPLSPASNRAGYFDGKIETTSASLITSDQMFKKDVSAIKDAVQTLKKLKPHTYKMDRDNYPQFNFDDVLQYGFIAQEVSVVIPELVHDSYNPGIMDSLGNYTQPPVSYKSLNYNAFIPITIQAVNEITDRIGMSTLSDQSIKTNVQNLSGSLAKVKQMRGVQYDWSSAAQNSMDLDSLQHIGFIAQEINAIEPLLTFVDDSSLMHVNYDRVVPMLVESIKELDTQLQQKDSAITAMQAQINQILNNMESCCNTNHTMLQNNSNSVIGLDVELKDVQSIVLEQNVPNPFAEQTTISYFLPDNTGKAQMLFYNSSGKLIQSTELTQKGKGQLNVFASDLTNGIYTYTLVVDGKIIETKKMVKQ